MIRFITEGDTPKNGLNIYSPAIWKTSIGFKWRWDSFLWQARFNPTGRKFYNVTLRVPSVK